MFKFRVIEEPDGQPVVVHPDEFDSEFQAKEEAKRIVRETHNTCFIERFNGSEWQRGSIRYFWYFDHVCFWNPR